jgi:UDP-N-acetylmuramoyl-tripeptide--D-alanyl-D-alanine ligase
MKLYLEDIVKAIDGRCLNQGGFGNNIIRHICTNSKAIEPQSLFIPLKGNKFDGHDYIKEVFDKGSIAVLTEREEIQDERLYTIYVKDTRKALLDLGKYYRSLFDIPVIAITGSVGKTSTKDLVAAVLSSKYNVHKTQGNYNNDIGVPLTLFELDENHEAAVIEMGMNHFGEIRTLTMTAMPDIAIITNIGTSHIENLGSREGILQAKLEILDGLDKKGVLILNSDNDMLSKASNIEVKTVKYGMNHHALYRAENITIHLDKLQADIITPNDSYNIEIPTLGEHMILNALAAIAVADHLGLTKEQIQQGLKTYVPGKMRMNIKNFSNGIVVIDDTYNASLESMKAAVKTLESYHSHGKKIAILGDILETGDYAKMLHEQVGAFVASTKIQMLCAVGEQAKHIYNGCKNIPSNIKIQYYETKEACIDNMSGFLTNGDTVLVKASRGMQFEKIVDAIGKVNKNEK